MQRLNSRDFFDHEKAARRMSEARPDDKRDIDAILARLRAELGDDAPREAAAAKSRRMSVVRVEPLEEGDDLPGTDRKVIAAEEFETLDEVAFLRAAYRVVLGRDVDESGQTHYLPALRDGQAYPTEILRALRKSPEGQARGVEITNLQSRFGIERLMTIPIVGGAILRLRRFLTLPQNTRRLQRRIAAADRRHRETIGSLNKTLAGVRRSMEQIEQHVAEAEHNAEKALGIAREAQDSREAAFSELAAARRQLAVQSQALSDLIEKAGRPGAAPIEPKAAQHLADASLDTLYVAFENRFRGSTAAISERLQRYLDMFRRSDPVASGGVVLDIGCGRGEWLAILRDTNIKARGIDLNGAMAAEARALGLDVEEGDAIAHMRALPAGSLAAVTGFHIVEHLPFNALVALFDAAQAALAPDGFVLFETPNPENLVVGACTFNLDPTHNRPLPPDFLRFIAEARGFVDARVIRKDEDCDLSRPESGFKPAEINDWFRAPADYALYARKSGAAEPGA